MDDETLLNLLSMNPVLRRRIENILRVAGNLDDSIELADTAEEKLNGIPQFTLFNQPSSSVTPGLLRRCAPRNDGIF